jgi:hypothetical protein
MATELIKGLWQSLVRQATRLREETVSTWRELLEAEASAGTLATAFATGTLVSTIPVPLVDMAVAAYVARRFSSLPRAPFLAGMMVANNLVMAPLYASTPRVGGAVLGWLSRHAELPLWNALPVQILIGYLLIASGMAMASFVLAGTGFRSYKATRRASAGTRLSRILQPLGSVLHTID